MNVSEAIDKLTVKRDDALHFQKLYRAGDVGWSANESKAIAFSIAINTLEQIDEPQVEKVEVPDFVAEWYEKKKRDLEYNIIWEYIYEWGDREDNDFKKWMNRSENNPIETLIRMKDGYTVKPKRWVIKNTDGDTCYLKRFRIGDDCIDGESSGWIGERVRAFTFDDRAKADAVALLVEGTVEEV